MALTARSRSVLYQGLTAMIEDEVAVGELLSYFPARDVEEPATKEFVAAQIAGVRAEIAGLRGDMNTEISRLRGDMDTEISGLRGEMESGLADLRGDMNAGFAALRAEMSAMEARLTAMVLAQQRQSIQWTLGALVSLVALIVAMGWLQRP